MVEVASMADLQALAEALAARHHLALDVAEVLAWWLVAVHGHRCD